MNQKYFRKKHIEYFNNKPTIFFDFIYFGFQSEHSNAKIMHTTRFRWSDALLSCRIQNHWMCAETTVRAFSIDALAINTAVDVLTFICICSNANEKYFKGNHFLKNSSHRTFAAINFWTVFFIRRYLKSR